ncbi:MAG: glycosyltransferase family 2 protein [Litoreibacter sp.]
MHWKRRRYLIRAFRKSRELSRVAHRVEKIKPDDHLLFATMRNEAVRLPYFLEYYRALGIDHFLIVDNASDDGSAQLLQDQPDVSLWTTRHSYKASRFGMDWLNALLFKFGAGHWCMTVDADELFTFPHSDGRQLTDLTSWLDDQSIGMMGALMLDLYPKGPVADCKYVRGADPVKVLSNFDAGTYRAKRQPLLKNLWVQGGVRERVFFHDTPKKSPTLNKIPLIKWRRSYAYVNSTHSALPRRLNAAYIDFDGNSVISGALLHTKFLDIVVREARQEKQRREHFGDSAIFDAYYDAIAANPELWCETSLKYEGTDQLEKLGLINSGTWK